VEDAARCSDEAAVEADTLLISGVGRIFSNGLIDQRNGPDRAADAWRCDFARSRCFRLPFAVWLL